MEDLDYFTSIPQFGDGFNGLNKARDTDPKTGKILAKEYVVSIDIAKELATLENNENGKPV